MSLTLFKTARDGMSLSIFGKKEKGQAMKNLFLACLMLLAGSAWAEWVLFLDHGKAQFFF